MREFQAPANADNELLEDIIRSEVDEMIDGAEPLLGRVVAETRGAALSAFLNLNPGQLGPFSTDPLRGWRRAKNKSFSSLDAKLTEEETEVLQAMVSLLLWADFLAADGYADPRVSDGPSGAKLR